MTHEEIEKRAMECCELANEVPGFHTSKPEYMKPCTACEPWIAFAIQIHDAAKEEDANIVESKTLSRPIEQKHMALVDRREDQQSITAILIAKAIRSLKIGGTK